MKRIMGLTLNKRILIVPPIVALIVVALYFSTRTGSGEGTLNEAVEGGEMTLISVGRNYDSLTQFVQSNEEQSKQLLESAQVALETAKAKLDSARNSGDIGVVEYVDNYRKVLQASNTMAKGVDNLQTISANLTNAIYYYSHNNYEESANQASYCLEVLTPLLKEFQSSNSTLNDVNIRFIAEGHRDRVTVATDQYMNETRIYKQYIILLQSIIEGKAYLQKNQELEDKYEQLQNAISSKDYEKAEKLRQEISQILQSLQGQEYQNAAGIASGLDPSLLNGETANAAQELQNKLRNRESLDSFENYLKSLEKYLEALKQYEAGNTSQAEQAINEGLGILDQGQGGDPELQGLYSGLRGAFNSLLRNRDLPPEG